MVTLRTCDDGVKAGKALWSPPRGSGGVEAPPCPLTVRRRHLLKTFRTDDENISHEPRVWPEYHPAYYGAVVRDPDGNNVEAVCHTPE